MRLIDADKAISDYAHYGISHSYDAYDLEDILNEYPPIEAIPKADYENRLKADLEAILVDLQLEILEMKSYESQDGQDLVMLADIGILFQQKIDNLKGENE